MRANEFIRRDRHCRAVEGVGHADRVLKATAVPLMTDDNQRPRTRGRVIHKVKSWTMLFEAALAGVKTHDLRVLDRDYQVGDLLQLEEYDWGAQKYTGRILFVEITYITCARRGDPQARACAFSPTCLHPDYGVLSIRKTDAPVRRHSMVGV